MTQDMRERTPLAVLVSALSDQGSLGAPSPVATTLPPNGTTEQQWWSQKKRKRTVACGRCDSCGRDDCGTCLNCLDKPKFGGPGTKRQKCELKQQEANFAVENREPRIWAKLHLITEQEMMQMVNEESLKSALMFVGQLFVFLAC